MSTLTPTHDRPDPDLNPLKGYASLLRYMDERYCLQEEDLRGHSDFGSVLLASADCFRSIDRLVLENAALFRKSVRNALANLGVDHIADQDLFIMAQIVRKNIGSNFEGVETFLEGFHPLEIEEDHLDRTVSILREDALEFMNEHYATFFESFAESPHALSDTQMCESFSAEDPDAKFLSTYFDSACWGLVEKKAQKQVDSVARRGRKNWPAFLKRMKKRVSRSLEGRGMSVERRFLPENCFFRENGTVAFRDFREVCIPKGSRVLAGSEEYFEMIDEMKHAGVEVVHFSDLEDLIHKLDEGDFDYILVSEVSRLGTVFPLNEIHESRKLLSPETKLIVDACQSAGRHKHDMALCEADVVILSTQKGSGLGMGKGVLALAKDFPNKDFECTPGSNNHIAIARTAFAMNPDGLKTLSPAERQEAISDVAKACHRILDFINSELQGRVQVFRPQKFSSEKIGHALELEVRGVTKQQLCNLAASYGVQISDSFVSVNGGESVRIAFHPYMGKDSLKLLAYVLLQACELYPDE